MVKTMSRSNFEVFAVLVAIALMCVLATSSGAAAGDMTLVSRDNSGAQGDGSSIRADISSDGRYVAFESSASNLVANDTNGTPDVFVRDLRPAPDQTTTIERVSVGPAGVQADNDGSRSPTISADGRYVAFVSGATNLVANDTNGKWDVFVHDRKTGANTRVNVSDSGEQANETSPAFPPSISDDGRYVAFLSSASNLVPNDTIALDVFVHDRDKDGDGIMDEAGETRTERVSQAGTSSGFGGNGSAFGHSMSTNGRYVAFYDTSSDLVAGDTDRADVFVRDRQTGTLQRIRLNCSFSLCNTHLNNISSISSDGRYVAFQADATSVLTGNNNGVDSLDDVFVYDRQMGTARRVSVNSCGTNANGGVPTNFAISADGRYLTFQSRATNLVANDTKGFSDVFVRDLQGGTIERVSVGPAGVEADNGSSSPSISSDGRYVAFTSGATNLVAGDVNGFSDVFVHERGGTPQQQSECIAPSTIVSATTSSGAPYESDAWTNGDVHVTLSAEDNEGGSGTRDIRYSATGADPISQQIVAAADQPATFTIDAVGTTTISYFATDNEGNVEYPAKSFTVNIDRSAPTVDSVYPADAATDVALWGYAEASFSEAMDPDTLTSSTFTLTKQGSSTPVEATVSYETYDSTSHFAWLSPNSELAPNTTYTATIKGGASGARDLAGNALQEDYSWTFTTRADTTPPETFIDSGPSGTVSSTSDTFSFSSNESDATFECKLDNETFKSCTSPKIVPDQDFLTEGTHTFEVRATDSDGNTDPTPVSRTWTVDATAPTISNVSPTNQSQNVSLGTNVEATFSEAMNASTLTTGTFMLTKQGSSTQVGATVSHSSTTNKATLNPSSNLASNTTYTATIKGGSTGAKDSAGNALAQDYSWSFTTGPPPDTTAPKVSTATPTGTGVARGTNAIATFSERMDPTTITTSTFKLFRCSSTTSTDCATQVTNVTITRSTDGLKATLNPFGTSSTLLAGRTKFKVVVTTGAEDEAGNQLDQDPSTAGNQNKMWYFTTGRS